MEKIVVYVRTTPVADWQEYTQVDTYAEANQIYNRLSARGYYVKLREV